MPVDITTQFGELTLCSPIVIGACPMTAQELTRIALISAGAGAIVLPFSEEMARTYSRLYVDLRRRGTLIPANDLAIAATAVSAGLEILVGLNDEAHFRAVPGLVVRTL